MILAWNTRKSWWKQHSGHFSNIHPTFLRDFLSQKEEDTQFRTIWKRNLYVFLQLFVFFLGANLQKLHTTSNSRFHFWIASMKFELLTYLLAPSEHIHLIGRPLNKEIRKLRLSVPWQTKELAAGQCRIANFSRSAQGQENWAALLHKQGQFGRTRAFHLIIIIILYYLYSALSKIAQIRFT